MPEPLLKSRRTSLSKTTRTANNPHNPTAAPWTTARCHRLLRPLAAKLQALRSILQSNPSATSAGVGAVRQKPKQEPIDLDPLFGEAVGKAAGGKRAPKARVRSKPQRTYSGAGGRGAGTTTSSFGANDSYLSIWGDFSSVSIAGVDSDVNPPKKSRPASYLDPNNPLTLLHSLKSTIHPSIFSAYLGIYSAFESVLLSTNSPSTMHILPLRVLAARRIAHCILATSSEVDSDDIWYDAVADLGSGGEYLRELVRWHAIELVRDTMTEGFMGRSDSGLGIKGVLILLCKTVGAEQEAQSLLQTLFDLHPVISSPNNPALLALKTFFSSEPEVQYRFLTRNFPSTCSNPSWLGSPDIHTFLLLASAEIDYNPGIEALASRALEATFGLWGEPHILALAAQRREAAKRKAPPRGTKYEGEPVRCKTSSVMPDKIGTKAESMVLKMIESLILLSLRDPSSKARGVLQNLVRGFLSQTHEVRSDTEDVWGSRWPVAGKVAVLLQGLGYGDDIRIVEEISRCLEDVCGIGGKEGMKSLAGFIAQCYLPLYDRYSSRDEVQLLASRLLSLAAQSGQTEVLLPPETPRMPGRGIVTFTPGKPDLAPDQEVRETKRYLVSQLALQISVSFSLMDSVKRDAAWIKWLGRFEHKVIGLKIQTPGRVKAVLENPEEGEGRRGDGKKRKGWRYEEGLDLWVAVGATPGREGREKKGVFMACVQVEMGDGDWKDEYEIFDDELDVIASDTESEGSEYTRPVTPISTSISTSTTTSDDDDDDEFYSNIRTTPPRTLRRSPRGTARIRRSLASFAVNLSSPVFAMRTPAGESVMARRRFDLSVGESSPSSANGMGWWEDGGHSSPVLRRGRGRADNGDGDEESGEEGEEDEVVEEEGEEEYMEGETEGDISTLGLGGVTLDNRFTSPRVSQLSLGSKRKREALRSLDNLMDTSEEEEEEEEDGSEYQDEPPGDIDMELSGVTRDEEKEEEEEEEVEEREKMEETDDDLFTIAVNTALPSSSPPPPTPPPPPRRPKRMSLAGIKSMLNTNLSRTPSSEPTPTRDPTPTPPKKAAEPPTPQAIAFTPHRKIVDDPRLQRKIDKSARRRRRARERKRLRVAEMAKRLDEVSDDELGV